MCWITRLGNQVSEHEATDAKSRYLPRALGVLVMAAGSVYLLGSYTLFVFPSYAPAIEPIYFVPLVAETSLCLWLLAKGVNVEQWNRRLGASQAS